MQPGPASPESCWQGGTRPCSPGPRVPYATRAPRCLGPAGESVGPSLPCTEPGPPQGCPAGRARHSPCWGRQHRPRDPGLAGGDPPRPERVAQLPLLLFALHREPNTLTKQETAPSGSSHGHGHTPGPVGPREHLPASALPALHRATPWARPGPCRTRAASWTRGCRHQSHGHLGVTWTEAGAAPP